MAGSVKSVQMGDYSDSEECEDEFLSDGGSEGDCDGASDSETAVLDCGLDRSDQGHSSSGPTGWTVLDTEAIGKTQNEAIDFIVSIWGCKRSVAKALLMHCRWDREALLNVLSEQGPDIVYKQAGVMDSSEAPAASASSSGAACGSGSSLHCCQICFSDIEAQLCSTMDCGHTYCNECWLQHFRTNILEGTARTLRCMAYKCGIQCDEDVVVCILKEDKPVLDKYNYARLMSYVEDNTSVSFCPSVPWCGRAVQVDGDAFCEPECDCGVVFCFKCGKAPHSPCTCSMWDAWDEKVNGDSETKHWFTANTKPCPKCSKPVEKNGGCNHVTCKCGQSFCWLCGEGTGMAHTYQSIQGHSCGRWKEELDKKIDQAARNHKRYMHYFERFKQHGDSHSKEGQNRADLMQRIREMVETSSESRDYGWLCKALDQLKLARAVLSNSYAFAFFFFGGEMYKDDFTPAQNSINQNLFEDQQQMLELEVERLSGLVEACSGNLTNDSDERLKVLNSTVSIEARIVKLFGLIENDLYGKLQTCSAQIALYRPRKNFM